MVHMEVLKAREHVIPIRVVLSKNHKISVGTDMEKLEPLGIAGWECLKLFNCYGKLYGFPKRKQI